MNESKTNVSFNKLVQNQISHREVHMTLSTYTQDNIYKYQSQFNVKPC